MDNCRGQSKHLRRLFWGEIPANLRAINLLKDREIEQRDSVSSCRFVAKDHTYLRHRTQPPCDVGLRTLPAGGVMNLGLPPFFLPHVIKQPLLVSNPLDFVLLTDRFSSSPVHRGNPVTALIHLPINDYCQRYEKLLRQRLHQLPGGYELSVLRVVRELEEVCFRIAQHSAAPGSSGEEVSPTKDLRDIQP
jgi:hypothetical protein